MTEKFKPKNLREAWEHMRLLLNGLNRALNDTYLIWGFVPGDAPLEGIEDPGFAVRAAEKARRDDPLSLVLVRESSKGYQYLALACIDPTSKYAAWTRHELDDPADAAAFGLSGIMDVRFCQAAKEIAANVRMVRPGDPDAEKLINAVLAASGEVRH
jgi:hypothetical protein